ncbi:hypothetical protein [Devosia chinhatensis]|uniref:PepSY domain-containing protein n=1 Tax=Devosia chinhatensis TaxID=429727 RepID=A0A0F5FG82_9HYPH|nr:hypothetical protein [Devosia chinhatensis]KKB07914.1 hypothetical protein VE26_14955 [Devosia chinhatensis]
MIKNSVVALVTAAALAGVAMPAMAASDPITAESSSDSFNRDYVQYQLQSKGVNATSVEQWGNYVRAFVVGDDGRVTMQYFDEDTLAPIAM